MNLSLGRPRWLATLAALVAASSSGCVPPGIAWFPDSSGFVYTGGKDKCQLTVFEVGKKKAHALPVKLGAPAWPAVSPDGKRIATAWIWLDADRMPRMTVLVVDRAGKVVHRSRDLVDFNGNVLQVWWSPRGDKLLVSEEFWARLYDLKRQKLTVLPGPAITFGTTAVRPDGKAFLVQNGKDQYHLVDWDGKTRAIKPGAAALVPDDHDQRRGMLRLPLHAQSGWDGPVASVAGLGSRFRVDTARLSLTMEDYKPPRTAEGEVVRVRHSFPGGTTVRLVDPRLEVVRPGKAPRVLVRDAGFVMFFPSPDGKLLAVRWAETIGALFGEPKKKDRILVLGARGEVVADLNVGE